MPRPKNIPRRPRSEQGSLSIALILIVFILMFATLAASTISWQIAGDKQESNSRASATALDSTLDIAAENLGSSTRSLPNVPAVAPPTWTTSPDGTYLYRWWIESTTAWTVTTHAEVVLANGLTTAGSTNVYRAAATFSWDPVVNQWTPTAVLSAGA